MLSISFRMIFALLFLLHMGIGMAQQVLEKKLWALMLIPPHGDPVYLSSWILRESCERERTAFVRAALDKTAPLLGTRCIYRGERSWATSLSDWAASWFKPGKDSVWTPSKQCPLGRNYLDAYLEDAVASGRVTQEDLAQTFPSCPHLTSTSWPDGKVVLRQEFRWLMTAVDGKKLDPPKDLSSCNEYLLTFDQRKVLHEWQKDSWKGRCNKDLQNQEKPGADTN